MLTVPNFLDFTINAVLRPTFIRKLCWTLLTRSQAVAIGSRSTASQHLWESRDVIGHVAGGPLEPIKPLSLTVSEIGLFNVECNAMVDMTLIRTTFKQRSKSFILVPIDF